MAGIAFFAPILILLILLVALSVRILREYERGVVFTLGRFTSVKGPGLILLLPYIQQMVRVDQRTVVFDVPSQDVISRDNVSVKVNAVIYFRVIDPERAVIQVENFRQATSELAQTTLRSVLGKHDLDEMLSERDKLNHDIQEILDAQTDAWGIKVANVEIKHIDIDESMIRVIARQAEAERERRAKVISAEGEQQAAQKLFEAAEILAQRPEAMQLRYLSTLSVIGAQNNSTIVFPFPTDIGRTLGNILDTAFAGRANGGGGTPFGNGNPVDGGAGMGSGSPVDGGAAMGRGSPVDGGSAMANASPLGESGAAPGGNPAGGSRVGGSEARSKRAPR